MTLLPQARSVSVRAAMRNATSSSDTRTVLVRDAPTTQELIIPLQEIMAIDQQMATTTERLEADFEKVGTHIPRFPRGLRGIGGDKGRYIAPSVVAIGPYYHRSDDSPDLQKMEEVKLAAAKYLCRGSGHSTEEVYSRVYSVAGAARGCYDADDPSVRDVGAADFAAMMFLDGCFLLQYMVADDKAPVLQNRMALSTGPSILRDIFLLENQIPWLVLEALTEFMYVDVRRFVGDMASKFFPAGGKPTRSAKKKKHWWGRRIPACSGESEGRGGNRNDEYTPPHLLGLLRFTQVGGMPPDWANYRAGFTQSLCVSAVELAQIGIRLTPSTEAWFGEMRVRRGRLLGELSLSPVFLNDVTACWLVNMAALEATTAASSKSDGFLVSSYLSVLAMLMDRKEDVHELRGRRLLHGTMSNSQALAFFKGLGQHLRFGSRYFATLEGIDSYKRHRPVRIAVHKFVYVNYRLIAAFLSVTGVLIGIFKTLLSLKHR